jgi:regulator of RNase E activity RraA
MLVRVSDPARRSDLWMLLQNSGLKSLAREGVRDGAGGRPRCGLMVTDPRPHRSVERPRGGEEVYDIRMAWAALAPDVLSRCGSIGTSTWSDALDALGTAGVCDGLSVRSGKGPIVGQAVTIQESAQTDPELPVAEFRVGEVIAAAGPGQVLVVSTDGAIASTAGGLAAQDAARRGVAGFIIDGACRDIGDIRATGLYVASRSVTPRSGKGRIRVVSINQRITCGGIGVQPGDLVVADETGVVIVPLQLVEEALEVAERLAGVDQAIAEGLAEGIAFADLLQRFGPA